MTTSTASSSSSSSSTSVAASILGLLGADLEAEAIPPLATFFNTLEKNQSLEEALIPAADALALATLQEQLAAQIPSALEQIAEQGNAAIQTKLSTWLSDAQATIAAAGSTSSASGDTTAASSTSAS